MTVIIDDAPMTPSCVDALLTPLVRLLLPIRGVTLTLESRCDVSTRFMHTHALSAWLRHLARDGAVPRDGVAGDVPSGFEHLRLDAVESGRVSYRAGDRYRFVLFATAPGLHTLDRILTRLSHGAAGSVATPPSPSPTAAFGPHWSLVGVEDFFSGTPVVNTLELSAYGAEELDVEAAIWQEASVAGLVWQWTSPVRLLKPATRRGKGELRFCRDAGDVTAELLLERAWDAVGAVARRLAVHSPARDRAGIPPVAAERHDVFWVEDDYRSGTGEPKPKGGLLGTHRLQIALPMDWARLLVLSQYLGIGQGVVSGLGRFRLETPDGQLSLRRALPAEDWLGQSLAAENLLAAWRHVRESRQAVPVSAEVIDEIPDEFLDTDHDNADEDADTRHSLLETLRRPVEALRQGRYTPPPTRACLMPKPDGGSRFLAIPPFWDAVLQRAIAQELGPALDSLMHPLSFGYRRGRSRKSAADAITKARRDGFRWVYDADIEDFFGSVRHSHLHTRLLALLDEDPVVDAIMNWISAPVRWQGEGHPRRQGLPQGSNLSPLLANLMLDDFDNDMAAMGLRLVRFADDFVILCKSREQAEEASRHAAASLAEFGFILHPDKSRVVDIDDGLEFLGYLFVNDYAIDVSRNRVLEPARNRDGKHRDDAADTHLQVAHWLAKLGRQLPRTLSTRELEAHEAKQLLDEDRPLCIGEQFDPAGSVYVVGAGHMAFTEGGRLVVTRDDERVLTRPWRHLRHLFLMGNQHITTPALRVAARHGVHVHVTTGTGWLDFSVSPSPDAAQQTLWFQQGVTSEDPGFCLPIARALVAAKIRHHADVGRKREGEALATTRWLRDLDDARDLASINGIEGRAAAAFFEQFASLLPEAFGFSSRERRPPPDPVNALLSIGYTLLYANADAFLKAERLQPAFGVYHRARGEHAALASDMIEPFRHVVAQSVLTLLRRHSLKPEDFSMQPEGSGCLVLPAARRRLIGDLLSRLARPLKARGETDAYPLRVHLHRQCHSIALAINRRDPELFRVFRLR